MPSFVGDALNWIVGLVEALGYLGLAIVVALENVFPPIPSEAVLPLAGYLVSQGRMTLWGAILASTVGSVAGAVILYWLGYAWGEQRVRALVKAYGRWLAIGEDDLDRAQQWFERHGRTAVFVARLAPLTRSLISIPAGVARMPLGPFLALHHARQRDLERAADRGRLAARRELGAGRAVPEYARDGRRGAAGGGASSGSSVGGCWPGTGGHAGTRPVPGSDRRRWRGEVDRVSPAVDTPTSAPGRRRRRSLTMPPRTFDWRDDPTGTVIAVPDVRARFLQRKPDDPLGGFHSHEESNGIETWVVLEGKVRFEFDDGEVIATPGQSVVAYPHEKHRVSCAGDEPCVYFLTLTPHREPTHTFYDDDGNRLPSRVGTVNTTWCGEPSLGELPVEA